MAKYIINKYTDNKQMLKENRIKCFLIESKYIYK